MMKFISTILDYLSFFVAVPFYIPLFFLGSLYSRLASYFLQGMRF